MGYANDYLCPKNTVILGRKGTINRPIYADVEFWNVDTAFGLIANSERLSSKYLYYFCVHFDFERLSTTVTIPSLTKANLLKIEIPLPPLDEQERIAAELDAVVATLKKRRAQLAELNALVEARFVELFGALGTNPRNFATVALGDVCRVNPKKNAALFPNDDFLVSFVPMPAVSERGEIDASSVRAYRDVKKGFTSFEENDVLFAKITPCMENGKGAVARGLKNGVGFGSTGFHILRPTAGVANPFWLYQITAFRQFRVDAEKKMTGSAGQRRVPAVFLENYRVALPPFELQERFAAEVERVEALKATVRDGIAETQTLFDALSQRYFG